jgi:hypothetical protein
MTELEITEWPEGEESDDGATGSALTDFLYPAPAKRNTKSIIWWWESRRLHFNVIVGGTGLLSMGVFKLLTSIPPDAHSIPLIWAPVVAYGLLANACYLLGPTSEIAIEKLTRGRILPTGPGLFRMGLTFSVGLTLLPTLLAGMDWLVRIIGSIF